MPHITTNGGKKRDYKVLTLRIAESDKKKLHDYSMKRSRKLGRAASYNECLINLIRETAR